MGDTVQPESEIILLGDLLYPTSPLIVWLKKEKKGGKNLEKNKEPSILITFHEKNDHSFLDLNVNTTPQHVEDALLSLAAFLGGNIK